MNKLIVLASLLLSFNAFAITKINGAGATFPYPIYSKWFSEYAKNKTDVQFNYSAIGSGGGIRQLIKQTVDFGASDVPMKAKELKKTAWPVFHVPMVLGAVAVAYKLDGVNGEIKLDGNVLADIFMGKITKWNHPEIKKSNPSINLPSKGILIVRRSDGSGTTAMFSDYLAKVNPNWKSTVGVGKSLRWPTGIGAKGNDGVTNMIKRTDGAIGYIELAYATKNNLKTVAIKNKDGVYVAPTVESISASAAHLSKMGDDFKVSLTNSPGKKTYAVTGFTYMLLPQTDKNPKLVEVKTFLRWALTKGQEFAKPLHYAPLPKELSTKLVKMLK
jgi:phosphate transport system substrate-binding protein